MPGAIGCVRTPRLSGGVHACVLCSSAVGTVDLSLPGTAEWTRRPCIPLTSQTEIAATGSELVLRPHGNACEQSRRRHRSMRRRRREYCRLISCSAVAGLDGPPGALLYPGCGAGRRLSFSSCHAAPVQYCPLHPRLGPYFRVPAARGSAASDYIVEYTRRSCVPVRLRSPLIYGMPSADHLMP